MSDRTTTDMAPDGHTDSAGPVHLIAGMTITPTTPSSTTTHYYSEADERRVITTSPHPNGILFKGKKMKKRVSFRDSQLVNIREIPPRSSSGDEDSEDDETAGSSDSDEESDSESGEEEVSPQPAPVVVNGGDKPINPTVNRASPAPSLTPSPSPSSTSSPPVSTLVVRPERGPIPWTPMSSFTGAKGSYNVSASPAAKVVSLVSRITGVTPATPQTHLKPRSAPAATSTSSTSTSSSTAPARKPSSPVPPKKAPSVVRTEKKVKKITPTLDNVMTSQTVRSVQKHGAVSESLHKGSAAKTGRKKRTTQRRQEAADKRKATPLRKNTKDSNKQSGTIKAQDNSASRQTVSGKRTVSSAGARPKSVVNGFGHVRDSLSLPPLSSDDSVLLNPTKLLQHRPLATKTTVYSMDGFIFPGDPTHDLTTGLKTSSAASGAEDVRVKPQGTQATPVSGYTVRDQSPGQPVRDRVSSAPPGTMNRRKRFYAWQMANGNLQNSLHEPPSITPMWESITTVTTPIPKPAYVADR